MPPKKAAAQGAAAVNKKKAQTTKSTPTRSTTRTTAGKRVADAETEEPPAKRGRSAKEPATKAAPPAKAKAKKEPASTVAKTTKAAAKTKPATKVEPKPKAEPRTKAAAKAPEKKPATTSKKSEPAPAANSSKKRKAVEDEEAPAPKKRKAADKAEAPEPAPKKERKIAQPKAKAPHKPLPVINEAPTHRLDIFVFGAGESAELGLGNGKNTTMVKRPRLNPLLSSKDIGVVQLACGGMHVVALTHDNKIYTWGVNDQCALGRDTTWDGGLVDMDAKKDDEDSENDEEDDDNGLNPRESTPTAIPSDAFPEDAKIVQVAAGDSISLALTADGRVFAWGTFRDNQGVLGFSKDVNIQKFPALVPELKNITQLDSGANHVLALDKDGSVFAWGSGQQNQLGRRIVERTRLAGLTPREFGLPKKQIKYISCGADHSFAVDNKNNVWTWGLNNFGQCGIPDTAGTDDAIVSQPTKVEALDKWTIVGLKGGRHHTIGVADSGEVVTWGRADASQMGIKLEDIPKDDLIRDDKDRPRIVQHPQVVRGLNATFVAAASDHSIAITKDGKAYSWGYSGTFQTGQGTDEDVKVATLIDNTAVRERKLNWAGCGGQYSIIAAIAEEVKVNGTA